MIREKNDFSRPIDREWDVLRVLDADATGSNTTNAQPWFPTNGSVTLDVGLWQCRGILVMSTGATSHATGLSFGGTATISGMLQAIGQRLAPQGVSAVQNSTFCITNFSTTRDIGAVGVQGGGWYVYEAMFKVTVAGTLQPRFQFTADPTGTITIHQGTWFGANRISRDTGFTTRGSWS